MDGAMEIAPISSSFCVPYWTQFVFKHKSAWNAVDYTVKDGQGTLRFTRKHEGGLFSKLKRTVIEVALGNVLLSIFYSVPKGRSKAYHGDSKSYLLLTFKKKTAFCKPTEYQAFLAGNDDSSNPDFSIQKKPQWKKGFTICPAAESLLS